jgi:hypothetical protein
MDDEKTKQSITTFRLNKEVLKAFKKFCIERNVKLGITLETAMIHLIQGRVHGEVTSFTLEHDRKVRNKERQRCIAELKELKDKLLKEWQAMGGWGGNTIDTAKAGAEFQVIDRAIAKLKDAPAEG